jgi:predicted Rossmann-fold nucleotide-binding protein
MLAAGRISEQDLDLFHLTDSPEEAVDVIQRFYKEHIMAPNF